MPTLHQYQMPFLGKRRQEKDTVIEMKIELPESGDSRQRMDTEGTEQGRTGWPALLAHQSSEETESSQVGSWVDSRKQVLLPSLGTGPALGSQEGQCLKNEGRKRLPEPPTWNRC